MSCGRPICWRHAWGHDAAARQVAIDHTLLALHNPVYLAHRLAMLDHMARGRFQWGIGGGAIPTDLALFGIDPSEVRARSAEVKKMRQRTQPDAEAVDEQNSS